jgi:prepilin-type N-terminal cleavage/methylation domain-containing protein
MKCVTRRRTGQQGYSLIELLVVVSIVGVLALVTVPAFISMRNSSRMKAAMRNFTTDLRSARQLAIARGLQVKVSFVTGAGARQYDYFQGNSAYSTVPDLSWTAITGGGSSKPSKQLDTIVYFPDDSATTPQTFTDTNISADGTRDVIFFPDGRAQIPGNATSGTITIKTDMNIPKSQYAVQISPSGRVYVP